MHIRAIFLLNWLHSNFGPNLYTETALCKTAKDLHTDICTA